MTEKLQVKCPCCGMEFSTQEAPVYKCKDCAWLEDDGYCGFKAENVSGEMIACDEFVDWEELAEHIVAIARGDIQWFD